MSLPAIAQHMSSYGRNGDSMLVHMTPSEVHGLQALAEKNGTSLTINPDTGLPEAFSLKSLVPIAAGAMLGPAGFGIASSALGAAAMVGGVTALASGNLQQGLMAGLGAYGGYGLGAGLAGVGAEELAKDEAAKTALSGTDLASDQAYSANQARTASALQEAATNPASTVESVNAAQTAAAPYQATPFNAAQTGQTVQTVTNAPSAFSQNFDKASAGFDRLTSPGGIDALSKQMATNAASSVGGPSSALGGLGYSAAGALGMDAMSQKNPAADAKKNDPGYIRPFSYNPFGQKYTAYTPVKADEWGSRSLATGGIVALADGGSLAEQRMAAYKQFEAAQQPQAAAPAATAVAAPSDEVARNVLNSYAGQNLSDAQMQNDMNAHGITTEQFANVTGTPLQQAQARATAAPFNSMTGGSKAAYDYLMGSGEYPTRPYTPTGEIYKPYAEATMGMKADPTQFATTFNPATRQYEDNPNYKPFNYDKATGQDTRGLSSNEINQLLANPENLTATKPEKAPSGWINGLVDKALDQNETRPYWMVANNLTYDDLSRATGSSVADVMKRFPKTTTGAPAATSGGVDTTMGSWASGGITALAGGGQGYNLGGYSDGGRLLKGPGDGVSDSIPASIGDKQPARLADGEFVVPARIVSELGNGSTDAGARKLYQMMDRVQNARGKTTGKGKVAANSRADKYLPV